ncbi:MAG: UDP-N-acetylmuramoyl-L-alanine--D-glutamate ligase [Deltaproteobacteria bacterium]|nr:MAG: UDP-N-acetylmuramoyl-L-alanine--D-glutamate ligase [Deltaproteobacteria bacterium]
MMTVEGVRFTVVGAGRSGLAASNALASRGGDVRLVEARPDAERPAGLDARVAFEAGTNAPRPGDIAVLSPGVPEVSPVRAEIAAVAAEVIGEVELFYRLSPAPILAITGTDGKSTTTTMLGAIAAAANPSTFVGGNLGNPLCEGLDELTASSLVIAEISCFQLTTCVDFRPRVAIVTNIAEDHLNYHGSFAAYQAAKQRVWAEMTGEDTLILNADDPYIAAWERPEAPRIRTFSLTNPDADAYYDGETLWVVRGGRPEALMRRDELALLGRHNVANALAAGLAADAWGIPLATAREALMAYAPLPHRLAPVATIDGVRWVNDSKATNANAAAAGIRAIEAPLILLAGGSEKDADFTGFGALVRERTRAAILFGQTRHRLAEAIGDTHRTIVVETLDEAVAEARALAEPGDTVLLGPACASYDQFQSYGHRGEVFTAMVQAMRAD